MLHTLVSVWNGVEGLVGIAYDPWATGGPSKTELLKDWLQRRRRLFNSSDCQNLLYWFTGRERSLQ